MPQKIRTLTIATIAVALTLFASSPARAQISSATNGEPVVATGASTGTSSPAYIDAYVETGGATGTDDICLRIQSVYSSSLIPAGGSAVVDARGFNNTNPPSGYSAWACSVNPFAASSGLTGKSGKLLLGFIDIPAAVTWVIPSHIIIEGIGTNGVGLYSNNGAGTIIHATSSFSEGLGSTTAVLQMGLGGTSPASQPVVFGIQIRNLTVDCNATTTGSGATVGVLNNNAEEGSLLNNVQIFDCPAIGLHVTTNNANSKGYGAVNSGPYQDVFINFSTTSGTQTCGACGAQTVALQVDGDTTSSTTGEGRSVRGFDNFTVSGNNLSATPDTLISIFGVSTAVTNSHVEYCSASTSYGCIEIGNSSSYTTAGVRISDVTVSNNSNGFDVIISNVSTVGNVLIENLNHESINSNTIKDLVTGYTLGDNYLGWYHLGTGSTPAIFTSSTSLSPSSGNSLQVVGNANVTATFTAHTKSFKIDHPLDPEHEYLTHSVIESPDMMNLYNGTVTTDKRGLATVILPHYFEALNRDFHYQLTPIGQFAQAMVAQEIKGNRFVVKTNKPGVEVSWQVTGVRHDRYATEHPMHVEEPKPEAEHNR
jgi:hypothetical protein